MSMRAIKSIEIKPQDSVPFARSLKPHEIAETLAGLYVQVKKSLIS
jgi:hypothetical protein